MAEQQDHPRQQQEERYQPLALIGVTLVALLGFAVFFLSFLVAPLAILVIFYVGFALSDRSKRNGGAAKDDDAQEPQEDERDPAAEPAPAAAAPPSGRRGSAALLARAEQQRRQTIERSDQSRPDER